MSHLVAVSSIRSVINHIVRQPRGDAAERISAFLTVTILALLSAVLLTSHFWGEPITCWTPAEYPSWWSQFVNQYCYVHGTYYVPLNRPLSWNANERREVTVYYYQWVPYLLALQAIMFYLPRYAWKFFCTLCGVDVPALIRHVDNVWHDCRSSETAFAGRIGAMQKYAVPYIWDSLRIQRRRNLGVPTLFACYLMSKMLHAINAIMQWIWLNRLLHSPHYEYWGWDILRDLRRGADWQTTGHFPRITHCDFSRRKSSAFNLESVTCVLTLNVYYEKIFLFLWFWMLFVAVVDVLSALYWLVLFCCSCCNSRLVHKYLAATEGCAEGDSDPENSDADADTASLNKTLNRHVAMQTSYVSGVGSPAAVYDMSAVNVNATDSEANNHNGHHPINNSLSQISIDEFTWRCLQMDGMLILRLVAINLGDLPAAYLARALYRSVDTQSSKTLAKAAVWKIPMYFKQGKQV